MPAAPRSCLHPYGGQDGGRDLYRGLQHHPAGLERDYEQEFIVGHGHAQIGQLCADLRRTCHGAAAASIGGSCVKDSVTLFAKRELPRPGGRDNRIRGYFAGFRSGPWRCCGRVADAGCQSPPAESPPVSNSGSRAAASPGDQAVTAERCAAQRLCGDPAGSAGEVAGRLLAIPAQDPRGARLAIRARSAGLSASDVDSALARGSC
jgi:hypothetical protein